MGDSEETAAILDVPEQSDALDTDAGAAGTSGDDQPLIAQDSLAGTQDSPPAAASPVAPLDLSSLVSNGDVVGTDADSTAQQDLPGVPEDSVNASAPPDAGATLLTAAQSAGTDSAAPAPFLAIDDADLPAVQQEMEQKVAQPPVMAIDDADTDVPLPPSGANPLRPTSPSSPPPARETSIRSRTAQAQHRASTSASSAASPPAAQYTVVATEVDNKEDVRVDQMTATTIVAPQQPQAPQDAPEQQEQQQSVEEKDADDAKGASTTDDAPSEQSISKTEDVPNDDDLFDDAASDLSFVRLNFPEDSERSKQALQHIDQLRKEINTETIPDIDVKSFEEEVGDDVMLVGSIPLEQVEEQERLLEEARVKALREEMSRHEATLKEVAKKETSARQHLHGQVSKMKAELHQQENMLWRRHRAQLRDQQEAFRKAEDRMLEILRANKGAVQRQFGELREADDMYGSVRGRRYRIDWRQAPRLVRIRLDLLRAVKNKLPRGRYAMMVTLYDRLGGHPLRWSNLDMRGKHGNKGHPPKGTSAPKGASAAAPGGLRGAPSAVSAGGITKASSTMTSGLSAATKGQRLSASSAAGVASNAGSADHEVDDSGFSDAVRRKWTGTTSHPIRHDGKFSSLELSFAHTQANNIYIACPSEHAARPSMCFVFELFLLRGRRSKVDKVVAWGAFPMTRANFEVIEGKFKVPLLRGELDPSIDKFERIENRIGNNLDSWLCNLYFDIRHLPRYLDGQTEYEVELQFTNELLQLKTRADEDDDISSGDDEVGHSDEEEDDETTGLLPQGGSGRERKNSADYEQKHGGTGRLSPSASRLSSAHSASALASAASSGHLNAPGVASSVSARSLVGAKGGKRTKVDRARTRKAHGSVGITLGAAAAAGIGSGKARLGDNLGVERSVTRSVSRSVGSKHGLMFSFRKNSTGVGTRGSMANMAKRGSTVQRTTFWKGGGSASRGNLLKASTSHLNTLRADRTLMSVRRSGSRAKGFEASPSTAVLAERRTFHRGAFKEQSEWGTVPKSFGRHKQAELYAITDPARKARELEKYTFSVLEPERDVPAHSATKQKLRYLWGEFVADLGLTRWKTLEFWATVTLMLVVLWFRLYTHYFGQWLYLRALDIPIVDFTARTYTVDLVYNAETVNSLTEVGTVSMGPLANIVLFSLFMITAWTSSYLLGTFPDTASRFLLAFGVGTLLDPLLIVLVDIAQRDWNGDSFKLYNFFLREEGNGLAGIFLTVIITAVVIVCSTFLLYHYLLHIHMNGRMLDVHYRVNGNEGAFLVPDDMEISVDTLRWIVTKAKGWRGFHGSTRKIAVTSYVLRDHLDPEFSERTVHLALYTQDLYGKRMLYRHFVRRADGAILELFGPMEFIGSEDYKHVEKMLLGDSAGGDENDFLKSSTRFKRGRTLGGRSRTRRRRPHALTTTGAGAAASPSASPRGISVEPAHELRINIVSHSPKPRVSFDLPSPAASSAYDSDDEKAPLVPSGAGSALTV